MESISISKVRENLPELVRQVSTTRQPIVLLRYGKPSAMLAPIVPDIVSDNPYPLRKIKISMSDHFDAPMDDMWEACQVAEAAQENYKEKGHV